MSDETTHLDERTWAGFPLAMVTAVVTTLVIAVPYWAQSYAAIKDDGIFGSLPMVEAILFLGTGIACAVVTGRAEVVLTVTVVMLVCLPVAVLGRIVIDTAADPTSHDLWPLELVLAWCASVPAVGAGALVAWPVRRLRGPS